MGAYNASAWNSVQWNFGGLGPPQAATCVVTLSSLQNKVLDRLDNNTQLYPPSEVTTFINEAIRVMNVQTGFLQGSFTTTSISNRSLYDFPFGTVFPLRVQFGDYFLQPTGINMMGQRKPYWQSETIASTGVPVTQWIPYGLKRFAIYPADFYGGATITLTCVVEPALLSSGENSVQLPGQEYIDIVVDYAHHIAILKEGGKAFSDSMPVFQRAMSKMKQLSIWQGRRMPFYGAEVAQVGVR